MSAHMKLPIYMDYNSTTPLDSRVLHAMMPYLTEHFGNAASRNHVWGWTAEAAVENARAQLARLINATPKEIIFTSGATEADNLAIKGIAYRYKARGNHIITAQTENRSVLGPCRALQKEGFDITYLAVDRYGRVDPEAVRAAITPKTILISIMYANHEIGSINPIAEIGELARENRILLHTNAAQALGKIETDVQALKVDLLSMSGHKFYGPKGVGALYVRRKTPPLRLHPLLHGDEQEKGWRSGTLNVPGIVGMGAAADVARQAMPEESQRLLAMRNRLEDGIFKNVAYVHAHGHPEQRLPNTSNLSFEFIEGESFLMEMKDVALSSGSPCTSATTEPSYVIMATGAGAELALASVRFSLGRLTTEEEIDFVVDRVVKTVGRLRELSPLYDLAKEGSALGK
jgi:cysteine desulfurase